MTTGHDSMIYPEIEGLIDIFDSKFSLCTVAAARAREINAYFGQLGGGIGNMVPPQVNSVAHKPLSIAFEELDEGKIVPIREGDKLIVEDEESISEASTPNSDVAVVTDDTADSDIETKDS